MQKTWLKIGLALLAGIGIALTAFVGRDNAMASDEACHVAAANPCKLKGFKPKNYNGKTSFWIDTDGVKPGEAGCHIEVISMANQQRPPNGRVFGEDCVGAPQGQPMTILIETNPGADKIHAHAGDEGAPDRVDCVKWCQTADGGKKRTGQCQRLSQTVTYMKKAVTCESAKCVCQ